MCRRSTDERLTRLVVRDQLDSSVAGLEKSGEEELRQLDTLFMSDPGSIYKIAQKTG